MHRSPPKVESESKSIIKLQNGCTSRLLYYWFFFHRIFHTFLLHIQNTFPDEKKNPVLTHMAFKIYIYTATGSWTLSCVAVESLTLAERPSISGCVCVGVCVSICLPYVTLMGLNRDLWGPQHCTAPGRGVFIFQLPPATPFKWATVKTFQYCSHFSL